MGVGKRSTGSNRRYRIRLTGGSILAKSAPGLLLDQSFSVRRAISLVDSPSLRRLCCIHGSVLSENGRAGNEVAGRTLTFSLSFSLEQSMYILGHIRPGSGGRRTRRPMSAKAANVRTRSSFTPLVSRVLGRSGRAVRRTGTVTLPGTVCFGCPVFSGSNKSNNFGYGGSFLNGCFQFIKVVSRLPPMPLPKRTQDPLSNVVN